MDKKILKKDIVLFKQLRNDSRASLTQISKKTNIPISTLYDRLKYHEGTLIKKHVSILNFGLLGYGARLQLLVKAPIETRSSLKNYLLSHESVNNLLKITGGFDYSVECYFKSIPFAEEFVEGLEKDFNAQFDAHYVVDDIKQEGFLAA